MAGGRGPVGFQDARKSHRRDGGQLTIAHIAPAFLSHDTRTAVLVPIRGLFADAAQRRVHSENALLRLLPLRGPISLHAFSLSLALCGTPAFTFGSRDLWCSGHDLRRSTPPLRRSLEGLNSSVQFVTFRDQQGDNVFGGHRA